MSSAESGFYYLKSRYYDPEICRFINADDPSLIGANGDFISHNLFTYCGNNPTNRSDPTGQFSPLLAAGLIGGIVGSVSQILTNTLMGNKWSDGVAGAFVGGFTYAAVSVTSLGNTAAAAYAAAGAEAIVNEVISYKKEGKTVSSSSLTSSALTVLGKTAKNGSLYLMAGKAADKIKINWGNLSKNAHYFIRRDAPAIITQSCYQATLVLGEKVALDCLLSPSVSKAILS